jgi:hypothetical protein
MQTTVDSIQEACLKRSALIVALLVVFVPKMGVSATYYIDFSSGNDSNAGTSKAAPWQHAPGMTGYTHSGYSHSAGDQFILKGGVTWDNTIAPWNYSYSGVSGSPDYIGVDRTWFAGASWTPPIINGGSMNPIPSNLLFDFIKFTGSNITLDGWEVTNIGVPGTNQGNYAILFSGSQGITVENMVLPVESRVALLFIEVGGTTVSGFSIHNNDISECSWGVGIGVSTSNTVVNGVSIYDNAIHDFHDQMADSAHGDGIMLYGPSASGSDASFYVNQPVVYGNSFYGDFSASDTTNTGMNGLITLTYNVNGPMLVYDNWVAVSNSAGGESASAGASFVVGSQISGIPDTEIDIYNNSVSADTAFQGLFGGYGVPLKFENNILLGGKAGYYIGSTAALSAFTSDYNDFYGQTASCWINEAGSCKSYAQFVAQGYEAHGLNKNPDFIPAANVRLVGISPVIGRGVNLSSIFTTDAAGNPRPSPPTAWDMGAFQTQGKPPSLTVKGVH